jgi:hypothetical protein
MTTMTMRTMETMTTRIEMTEDVRERLVFMAGYACGAAMKEGERDLAQTFLDLSRVVFGREPKVTP